MNKVYLLLRKNLQTGPYTYEELLQQQLLPTDLIWVEGKSTRITNKGMCLQCFTVIIAITKNQKYCSDVCRCIHQNKKYDIGKVIYERSFGHLTYEKQTPVTEETIYDLASVTKVAATLQSVMFMHDRGLININKKASHYYGML